MITTTKTISFQIVSDLHLELVKKPKKLCNFPVNAPYLALLGDIGRPHKDTYVNFLAQMSAQYQKIFVITGNHEYYNEKKNRHHTQFKRTCAQQNQCIADLTQRFPNIIFLNNTSYLLDGFKIVGTTLWTHIPKDKEDDVLNGMNDYEFIFVGDTNIGNQNSSSLGNQNPSSLGNQKRSLHPSDVNQFHQTAVDWLTKEITTSTDPVIVFTHHAPLLNGTSNPIYKNDPLQVAYCSDQSHLMTPKVKLWAFGHTHFPCDFTFNDVRVVSNPHGYPDEKPNNGALSYDSAKIFTVIG